MSLCHSHISLPRFLLLSPKLSCFRPVHLSLAHLPHCLWISLTCTTSTPDNRPLTSAMAFLQNEPLYANDPRPPTYVHLPSERPLFPFRLHLPGLSYPLAFIARIPHRYHRPPPPVSLSSPSTSPPSPLIRVVLVHTRNFAILPYC